MNTYIHICVCVYICIYMYVCMYVCICINTHKEIFCKDLAHAIMETGKSKICSVDQQAET